MTMLSTTDMSHGAQSFRGGMRSAVRLDHRPDMGADVVLEDPLDEIEQRKPKNYGTRIISGPMGSGKTALAVRMAHPWANKVCWYGYADGASRCGKPFCLKRWRVFTNLKSTEAWAKSLNLVQEMKAGNNDINHAIIIGDEIHQAVDSRRSMRNENIDIATTLTLIRKRSVIVWLTTQSINKVDGRIRDEAMRFYDVWSPDEGKHVYALRYDQADGSVPPWERGMKFRGIGKWFTKPFLHLYKTEEIIDMSEDFLAARREPQIPILMPNGAVRYMAEGEAVWQETNRLISERVRPITPVTIAQEVLRHWNHPIKAVDVHRILVERSLTWDKKGHLQIGKVPEYATA